MSAPSGAGKSTLCRAVRRRFADLAYSISYTTRGPRAGERDGVDYHFIDAGRFEAGIAEKRWAEWARVHDHYYGTSARYIEDTLAAGRCILLDIDVQGAGQIIQRYPAAITIFILPPSMDALKQRLIGRDTDSPAVIARRLENAQTEMRQKDRYRYVIVNDDLNQAIDALTTIIEQHYPSEPDHAR